MKAIRTLLVTGFLLTHAVSVLAQAPASSFQTTGAQIVVPAFGEVRQANDQARLTLMVEEQDKDKAAAASRVNSKMKQGTEIVRRADPGASLQTRGYFTYAVYDEPVPQPRAGTQKRQLIGWRVGQYLEVTTTNLDALPKTVAAAQGVLAVQGLHFSLSPQATRKLDEQRIAAAWQDLSDRIHAIARAMGRNPADAVVELVDFEGTGAYGRSQDAAAPMAMRANMAKEADMVEEPSFEPGETTLQMRVVGKLRFR